MSRSIFAEFDGSVIIPDQPLDYPAGQRLRITVETAGAHDPSDSWDELPPELERRDDGAIVVRGLRVSLYLIVDAMYQGAGPEEIQERYPQINEHVLGRILDFCREHAEPVRCYFEQQQEAAQRFCDAAHQGPSGNELRARQSGPSHG